MSGGNCENRKQMLQRIAGLEKEKERRIHWQGLAYAGMTVVDRILDHEMRSGVTEDEFKADCVKAEARVKELEELLGEETYAERAAVRHYKRIKELEQELLWAAEACEKAETELAEIEQYNKVFQEQREDVYNEGVEDGKSKAGSLLAEVKGKVLLDMPIMNAEELEKVSKQVRKETTGKEKI